MMESSAFFRPSKRRKFVKRHDSSEDETVRSKIPAADEDGDTDPIPESTTPSMAEVLRIRKQNRSRLAGVSFSNSKTMMAEEAPESMELSLFDPVSDRLKAMSDRFIGHSDQVVDVDKHMMAYVDSEMAKRRTTAIEPSSSTRPRHAHPAGASDSDTASSTEGNPLPQGTNPSAAPIIRNPASLGQLQEIDLGPSAHARAMHLTSAALARQSNHIPTSEDTKPIKPRKPRLGSDGKPLRPRPRRRRLSADIARDALVEQVLNENRLDLYDGGIQQSSATQPGQSADNDDADEQLAAQFRQEFLDAMASRQQAQQGPPQQKAGKAAAGDVGQKGPKLGGSRSARAAMALAMKEKEGVGRK